MYTFHLRIFAERSLQTKAIAFLTLNNLIIQLLQLAIPQRLYFDEYLMPFPISILVARLEHDEPTLILDWLLEVSIRLLTQSRAM